MRAPLLRRPPNSALDPVVDFTFTPADPTSAERYRLGKVAIVDQLVHERLADPGLLQSFSPIEDAITCAWFVRS